MHGSLLHAFNPVKRPCMQKHNLLRKVKKKRYINSYAVFRIVKIEVFIVDL